MLLNNGKAKGKSLFEQNTKSGLEEDLINERSVV